MLTGKATGYPDCMGSRGVQTAERIEVTCAHPECQNVYLVRRKRYEAGRGRYCSPECRDTAPRGKRGKYVKHKDNPTSVKPGQHLSPGTEFQAGQDPWNKGTASGLPPASHEKAGSRNMYARSHQLLARRRGRAAEHSCSRADETCKGPMHWASLTGDYGNLGDYAPMCASHHQRYDRARGDWGVRPQVK